MGSTLFRLGAIATLLLMGRALLRRHRPEAALLEPPERIAARARQGGKPRSRRGGATARAVDLRH